MIVAVPKETLPGERRVALVPDGVKALAKLGLELRIEAGAGAAAGCSDADYQAAGARVESDRAALLAAADLVLGVNPPDDATIARLREGRRGGAARPPIAPARGASGALGTLLARVVPRITLATWTSLVAGTMGAIAQCWWRRPVCADLTHRS